MAVEGSKAIECKFCGHWYINPCDAARAKKCGNQRVAANVAAKTEAEVKPKTKRVVLKPKGKR